MNLNQQTSPFDPVDDGLDIPSHNQNHTPSAKATFAMERMHPYVQVDLSAIRANYRLFANLAPDTAIAPVVKCDGYGLGATEIALTLIQHENCDSFYVAYPEEGRHLMETFRTMLAPEHANRISISVLNGPSSDTLALFRDFNLTPVLNSVQQATLWTSSFPEKQATLHIDTGMNRLGVCPTKLTAIHALEGLNISMVMSHLVYAGGDSETISAEMNAHQRAQFLSHAIHFPDARLSLAASGAALVNTGYHYSQIRLGISLYGIPASGDIDDRLQPVARLYAPVIQLHEVRKGESVGYDASWRAPRNSRIATVALGYGDGYPRLLSNKGHALIDGIKCPIAGRVSMDLITLDVTDVPHGVGVGDVAEFFGPGLPIQDVANSADTIAYELLTTLGPRIERIYSEQD